MTLRHLFVILALTAGSVATGLGLFAPSLSMAQDPGIGTAAPNASLRTAARSESPATSQLPAPAPSAPSSDAAEQRVVELVNAERAARALRPLTVQSQLAHAADVHALDQRNVSCRRLSHTGSDGSDVGERVDRTGYQWSRLAENIACGARDAASVMDGWMASDGHRRNILHPDLTHIGVSLKRSDGGDTYWVQVFGTTR